MAATPAPASMRAGGAMVALVVSLTPLMVALSGCLSGCNDYTMRAEWTQEGVPDTQYANSVSEYEIDHLSGGVIVRDHHVVLYVSGKEPVTQAELEYYAENLFADRGWPAPRLDEAETQMHCSDVI